MAGRPTRKRKLEFFLQRPQNRSRGNQLILQALIQNKIDRQRVRSRESGRQTVRRLWCIVFGVEMDSDGCREKRIATHHKRFHFQIVGLSSLTNNLPRILIGCMVPSFVTGLQVEICHIVIQALYFSSEIPEFMLPKFRNFGIQSCRLRKTGNSGVAITSFSR